MPGVSSTLFEEDAPFSARPWGGSSGFAHLGRDAPAVGIWDGPAAGLRSSDRPPELGQEAAGPPLIPRQERRAAGKPPPESAGVWDGPASGVWDLNIKDLKDGPGTGADHDLLDGTGAVHHRSAAVLGEDTQSNPPASVLGGLQRESPPPSALTSAGKHSD